MKRNIIITFLLLASIICFFSNFTLPDNNEPHPYKFDYPDAFGKPAIPADNPLTDEGVWLGRLLFYDSLLSINHKIACAGCHKQELSFTDGRPLAIGVFGDTLTRNSMALVDLAWGKVFFWNGRAKTLEGLVKEPIANFKEMGGLSEKQLVKRLQEHAYYPTLFKKAFPHDSISLNTVSKAIAQFLRTIVTQLNNTPEPYKAGPGMSKYEVLETEDSPMGSAARVSLMECKSCHTSVLFGGEIVTTYGNDSVFKATSLMNIRYTAPYMHDGRFKTMREVLQFYNDSMQSILAQNAKLDLSQSQSVRPIQFTKYDLDHADEIFASCSDSTVITNPAFSDPFRQKGFKWLATGNEAPAK